jgi:predicted O-linked N-acetylglucosamine transferase (SPINDLY family)
MGEAFAGRVAASLLKAVGLPELVTGTLDEYRSLALALGCDRNALKKLKEKLALAHTASALFDTARITRHLESAYGQMWQRQLQGQAPSSFTII